MTLGQHQRIFAKHFAMLILFGYDNGFEFSIGEVQRTTEQQQIYVSTGKSKTMDSKHLKKCAGDLNPFLDGRLTYKFEDLKILGDYWESLDPLNRWGGDWNKNDIKDGWLDTPHFERNV